MDWAEEFKGKERPRAFAAIFRNDHILMVHEIHEIRDFWTLPGGGLEAGESYEQAVIREVQEEVNLEVKIVKRLFSRRYEEGPEECFLVEIIGEVNEPIFGYDPELPQDRQALREVKWLPIEQVREDVQVSKVIKSIRL